MGVCVAFVVTLQGCASMGSKDPQAEKRLVQEKLDESLGAAEKAHKQGQTDQALQMLDEASRIDPAAKQPWLRKAQIHFEARQYGPAITQAQEALQRDVNDLTAKSILAVSGLRVSASALEQLRKANEVTGSARTEAESVAKLIREALGEPILIPALPTAAKADARPEGSTRPAPRRAVARPANPVVTATPVRPAPSGAVSSNSSRGNNPFGALQ